MSDRMIHKFAEGKYTVIFEGGKLRAERHGTPWRSLTGDGMVLAMLQEVDDLKGKVEQLSCREHDLIKLDTQSQVVINELQELLQTLTQPEYGLMPDVVAKIKRYALDQAHKSQGKTWEEATNVQTR